MPADPTSGRADDGELLDCIVDAIASYEGIDGLGNEWTGEDEPRLIALLVMDALHMHQARALPAADSPAMAPMHSAPTTQAMRQAAMPRSGSLRAVMVDVLRARPSTDDELETTLQRSHQSVSAARYTLVQQGWLQALREDGQPVLHPTRAGNPAQVWTLTPAARLRLWLDR